MFVLELDVVILFLSVVLRTRDRKRPAVTTMKRQDQTRQKKKKRKLVEPGLDNTCLFKRV